MLLHDVNAIWVSGLLGTFVYMVFVSLDYYLHYTIIGQMALIRLFFALPFLVVGFIIAYTKPNIIKVGTVQNIVIAIIVYIQISQFALSLLPQIHPYYLLITVSLISLVANILLNIRFLHLLVLNFFFFTLFQLVIVCFYQLPIHIQLFQYASYIAVLLFGLAGAYTKEYNLRMMFLEISKNKNQYEKLKVLNKQLATQQTDLEEFAFASSHDLKSPLRVIFGLSRLIERDKKTRLSKQSKADFADLKKEVVNMDEILKGLHNYSRIGIEQTEKINVNVVDVLGDIDLQMQHKVLPSNNSIAINYPAYIPPIYCSILDVLQLFKALIDNAFEHSGKENCIVNIDYSLDENNFVTFSLSDNGKGISGEYSNKIFRLFQTLEPKEGRNFGVGLAIAKKIVNTNGGTIYYDQDYTEGAKFIFTLPLAVTS